MGKPVYGPGFSMTDEATRRHEAPRAVHFPSPDPYRVPIIGQGAGPRPGAEARPRTRTRTGPGPGAEARTRCKDQDRDARLRPGPLCAFGLVPRSILVVVPASGAVALPRARPALLVVVQGAPPFFRALCWPLPAAASGPGGGAARLGFAPYRTWPGLCAWSRSSGVPRRGVILNSSGEAAGLRPRCAGPPRARPPT